MNLMSAMMIVALAGLSFYGWTQMDEDDRERKQYVQTLQVIGSVQKAFYRWHANERIGSDAAAYTVPTDAQVNVLAARYLPRTALTGRAGTATPVAGADAWTVTGLRLGPVNELRFEWPAAIDTEVELQLTGRWTDAEIHRVQAVLPFVREVAANTTLELSMRHPGSTAMLSNAMRRQQTGGSQAEGVAAALSFDGQAVVVNNDPCIDEGAVAVDALGTPMSCVAHQGTGDRRWKPTAYANVYCRDMRLTPADPNYAVNMPNARPIIRVAQTTGTVSGSRTEHMRATVNPDGTVMCPGGWRTPTTTTPPPTAGYRCHRCYDAAGALIVPPATC